MDLQQFIAMFPDAKRCGHGWMLCCPGHDDRTPSLKVDEGDNGKILLHDFGGQCTPEQICAALGLTLRDLWPNSIGRRGLSPSPPSTPTRVDWRRTSSALLTHAESLWWRAERTLRAATGIDISKWSAQALDSALSAVARAYDDLERVAVLDEVTYSLRARHLNGDQQGRHGRGT